MREGGLLKHVILDKANSQSGEALSNFKGEDLEVLKSECV